MLDTQTKQQLQQKFQQIKPQIQKAFPGVPEDDLSKGQTDPESLVSAIEKKTGKPKDQIEKQLKEFASGV